MMDCRCQVLDVDVQSYKVPRVTGNRGIMNLACLDAYQSAASWTGNANNEY